MLVPFHKMSPPEAAVAPVSKLSDCVAVSVVVPLKSAAQLGKAANARAAQPIRLQNTRFMIGILLSNQRKYCGLCDRWTAAPIF